MEFPRPSGGLEHAGRHPCTCCNSVRGANYKLKVHISAKQCMYIDIYIYTYINPTSLKPQPASTTTERHKDPPNKLLVPQGPSPLSNASGRVSASSGVISLSVRGFGPETNSQRFEGSGCRLMYENVRT